MRRKKPHPFLAAGGLHVLVSVGSFSAAVYSFLQPPEKGWLFVGLWFCLGGAVCARDAVAAYQHWHRKKREGELE